VSAANKSNDSKFSEGGVFHVGKSIWWWCPHRFRRDSFSRKDSFHGEETFVTPLVATAIRQKIGKFIYLNCIQRSSRGTLSEFRKDV